MFFSYVEANKMYPYARSLTYPEFPTKFVCKENWSQWMPRNQGFAIEKISHVPTRNGEGYYLRVLLNIQKGCMDFKDIRTVDGKIYDTFKDACLALGLLQDD